MTTTGYPPNESPGTNGGVSFRHYVNDRIAETARRFDVSDDSQFEFVCECGDLACRRVVKLTLGDYRAAGPGSIVAH